MVVPGILRTSALLLLAVGASGGDRPAATPTASLEVDPTVVRAGDLVFRRGRSLRSQAVLAAQDRAAQFSHVGLVVIRGDDPWIVHAAPGPEGVRLEPLESFLSPNAAGATALRRRRGLDEATRARIGQTALQYAGRAFDHAFDEASDQELYCTELVWRAYQSASIELIEEPAPLSLPFGPDRAILPSQLLHSPLLDAVPAFVLERNAAVK